MEANNTNYNEQLLKYLDGKLVGNELHEFEKQMAENDFVNDAVEGLETFKNKKNIDVFVNDLNIHLKQYILLKKKRKLKNKLELNDWTLLAILLIITLCVVAYIVIKKQ